MIENLYISTDTTGFSSPAENYVSGRLDTNQLLAPNQMTTFFFRASGERKGISEGDILVVDRSLDPEQGFLVILTRNGRFELDTWVEGMDFWGVVTFSIKKHMP